MFIYESRNSINVSLNSNIPVENPDIVIKGYKNGAAIIVGESVYGVTSGEEFDGRAKTLVYQKDGKLLITFQGIDGMSDPEVTIDDMGNNSYAVVVSGQSLTMSIVNNEVVVEVDEPVAQEETPAPMTGRTTQPQEEEPESSEVITEE